MNTNKIRNIAMIVVWAIVFVCPLLLQYYQLVAENEPFDWHEMCLTYMNIVAFFILFVVHHYVFLPLLYARKRYYWYALAVIAMLSGFLLFQRVDHKMHRRGGPKAELFAKDFHHGSHLGDFGRHPADKTKHHACKVKHSADNGRHPEFRRPMNRGFLPPRDIALSVILLLMFGVDLGADAMVKSQEQRRRLAELEQQNLKQQLDYLKYQINPHFFMNTLNNIHALVDLDQEKAKRSIVELSKLMRYMLYEGNGSLVSLAQELDFITQYISLMKLRYSDKVEIVSQMPETTFGIHIPPLLLITFIENAFKHGVSYQQQSFIHIAMNVSEDGKNLHFECCNSRHAKKNTDEIGGIGLENVRKRLDLIYNSDYHLAVDDTNPDAYRVILELKSL